MVAGIPPWNSRASPRCTDITGRVAVGHTRGTRTSTRTTRVMTSQCVTPHGQRWAVEPGPWIPIEFDNDRHPAYVVRIVSAGGMGHGCDDEISCSGPGLAAHPGLVFERSRLRKLVVGDRLPSETRPRNPGPTILPGRGSDTFEPFSYRCVGFHRLPTCARYYRVECSAHRTPKSTDRHRAGPQRPLEVTVLLPIDPPSGMCWCDCGLETAPGERFVNALHAKRGERYLDELATLAPHLNGIKKFTHRSDAHLHRSAQHDAGGRSHLRGMRPRASG